jgi:hypothetical protein
LKTAAGPRKVGLGAAVMKVKVSDPAFTYDLLCSLKLAAYTAAQTGRDTLEVRVPSASTPAHAELQLGFYLATWRSRHPGIVAELVDGQR